MFEPSYGRRYLIRNHQKLVIADESRAIIGGANVETTYLTDTGDKHWRDLWILIEGPAAKPASRYFDSLFLWTTTKGAKMRTLRRIVGRHSQSEGLSAVEVQRPAEPEEPACRPRSPGSLPRPSSST